MKNKHKVIIFSNLVLAGVSVGLMQNNAHAETTTQATVETTATNSAATADIQADQTVSSTNAGATTQAASETAQNAQATQAKVQGLNNALDQDDSAYTDDVQTNAPATTPTKTPIVNGAVTTGDGLSSLFDENGKQLTISLKANSDWYTDIKLSNQGQTYYRVSTNAYVNGNDVTLNYGKAENGVVRVQGWGAKTSNRNDSGFTDSGSPNLAANSVWQFSRTDSINGVNYWEVGNNLWINSFDATTTPVYSNGAGYLQISNTQIQPDGTPGYDLYNGVEGIKTYLVRQYFGFSNSHTIYDGSVINAVRNLQSRMGLPVTGQTDLATWKAMGFSEDSWYNIDSYVAPLQTGINSTRSDHIEAMINQAKQYLGKPWISGAASSPAYGVDCSGLVTQAMYAAGVSPLPVSAIQHAQPGNEWNSRLMWADWRMPHIPSAQRQRGDLVFFTDPSTGIIWHVGILLDANTMIESWPGGVQIHSIYGNRGNIAGFARVFE